MHIVYQFLKALVQLVLWIFYPKVTVVNRERLDFDYPAIVVSNHPNTLMDPLHSASRIKKQVAFLINAGMVSTPFTNWFFNTFYCIPIKRKQDTGENGVNNEDSFVRCDEFLGNGGCLFIAPEGSSFMERHLRDLKTGTARIALSAENKKDFQLGLKILPIGLNYEESNRFRSSVLVRVGEPIEVKDFEASFHQADFETARQLTDRLEAEMRDLIIDVNGEEEEQLVRRLEELQQNDQPLSPEKHFQRTKKMIDRLHQIKEHSSATFEALSTKLKAYFQALEQLKTSDWVVAGAKSSTLALSVKFLLLVLGFPLFLFGWINNYLPAKIPALLVKKLKLYVGYGATVKAISGMLTFPIFYFLQYKLVGNWLDSPWPIIYLLSLAPMGWLALEYRTFFQKWRQEWRFQFSFSEDQRQNLKTTRSALTTALSSSGLG